MSMQSKTMTLTRPGPEEPIEVYAGADHVLIEQYNSCFDEPVGVKVLPDAIPRLIDMLQAAAADVTRAIPQPAIGARLIAHLTNVNDTQPRSPCRVR